MIRSCTIFFLRLKISETVRVCMFCSFFCCKNKLGKRIKAASLLYWAASNLGKRKLGQRRFLRNKTLALFDRSLCCYNSSFLSWNRCLDFLAFVGVNLHKRPFAKPQAAILLDWGLCLVSVVHFTKKERKKNWVVLILIWCWQAEVIFILHSTLGSFCQAFIYSEWNLKFVYYK